MRAIRHGAAGQAIETDEGRRRRTQSPGPWAALAVLAVLTGLTGTAAAQDRADAVRQTVEAGLRWIEASGMGTYQIRTSAPVRVDLAADGTRITLPDLDLRIKDGDLEGTLHVGTIELAQAEPEPGRWRLSGSLPTALAWTQSDRPAPLPVTVDGARLVWDLDPADGFTYSARFELARLEARDGTSGVTLGGVDLQSEVRTGTGDAWTLPTRITLSDLTVRAGTQGTPVLKLGRVAVTGDAAGNGVDRLRAFQTQVNRLSATPEQNSLGLLMQMAETLIKPNLLLSSLAGEIELSGVEAAEEDGTPLISLGSGAIHGVVRGLEGNNVALELGYRHDGLQVPAAGPADSGTVPPATEVVLGLRNLPLATALAMLDGVLKGAPPPELDLTAPGQTAFRLLANAGATFELVKLRVDSQNTSVSADGAVSASLTSPYSATGTLEIGVRGLETLLRGLGDLSDNPLSPAEIALLAALGDREETALGVIRHYRLRADETGQVFLNGDDITPAVVEMAGLGPTTSGSPNGEAGQVPPAPDTAPQTELPAEATDGLLTAFTADDLTEVLRGQGLEPVRRTSRSGDPLLTVASGGSMPARELIVQFFRCTPEGSCQDVLMWSWITPRPPATLGAINEWNADNRWTRTYVDKDQDLRLEMDLRAAGGIGKTALKDSVAAFLEALPVFVRTFNGP